MITLLLTYFYLFLQENATFYTLFMTKNIETAYKIKALAFEKASAEFINWSEKKLITEIIKLRAQVTQLEEHNAHIEKAKDTLIITTSKPYNQTWSYTKKIYFLLLKTQKPLTASQLSTLLLEIDTHFGNYRNPANVLNTYLRRMSKSKYIFGHKHTAIHNFYYCLPEWVETDNTLKTEFLNQIDILE
jgi:hypothetical protein